MTYPTPDKITIERRTEGDTRLVDITFHHSTFREGAKATYPREEVVAWVQRWLDND